jgi:hypothetical protein
VERSNRVSFLRRGAMHGDLGAAGGRFGRGRYRYDRTAKGDDPDSTLYD